jgi:hypothetical protein
MQQTQTRFNSLNYWFPKIKDIVPVPKTEFVDLFPEVNKQNGLSHTFEIEDVLHAINDLATDKSNKYPIFVRTDQASNKHNMCGASKISDYRQITKHINEVLFYNENVTLLGLPYKNLVIREWIDIKHEFKAFKGTPIGKEVRVFIKDGNILCSHFYWPEKAIEEYHKSQDINIDDFLTEDNIKETEENESSGLEENWKEKLRKTKEETMSEKNIFYNYAQKVANKLNGYWSVDFACDTDGNWYLIDMALGKDSWHPSDCKHK